MTIQPITRTALITARAIAADAVAQAHADLGLVEHSELCRRLNLSHWACDGTCTTKGVPHCEEHGLPAAKCAYCAAVADEITQSHEQAWRDSAGREWKPLSTGEDLLWTETVVMPLTRSEVEEHFGRLTAGAAKFTSREDDPTVIDNDTWARLAGQPAAVIAAELGEDVANAAGLFCGLGDAQPHDRTTCPGWHA